MKKYQAFGESGFTLMEILVVLVLMTLILGISAALFGNTLSGAKRKAAAGEIVAELKYARNLA
ncbi:MAG TPA: prepilin-type N-terminal cleavage/methylation domain-containing protein, partial [Smithellaceae bacterium]|nr:prepilin-type N-terminal cleavage/methylation domain-containing protein [Smithellaceae bacterium]